MWKLIREVKYRLPNFKGAVNWYVTTLKLDLEARELIDGVSNKKPQHLRIKIENC